MTDSTLVLLRHAKAEPPERYRRDTERPLSERGHADARVAGEWLAAENLVPDLVLCSPALRTRETWADVAAALAGAAAPSAPPVEFQHSLYEEGAEAMLRTISQVRTEVRTLLVVGHNPTLSIGSGYLDPAGGDGGSLRTAGIAVHAVPGPWSICTPRVARRSTTYTARA